MIWHGYDFYATGAVREGNVLACLELALVKANCESIVVVLLNGIDCSSAYPLDRRALASDRASLLTSKVPYFLEKLSRSLLIWGSSITKLWRKRVEDEGDYYQNQPCM